jgi:hypothetical protein
MARLPPVTRERVREDLRLIFDEVSSGPGGVGTGPMSVLKYSPEMSRRAIPLFNYVRNESSLPPKVRELAMLTTARAKDCGGPQLLYLRVISGPVHFEPKGIQTTLHWTSPL